MRWPWQKSSGGGRRVSVRRERATPLDKLRRLLTNPRTGYAAIIAAVTAVVLSVITWWASSQPMVQLGRLAERTVVARESFTMADPARTAERRALARDRAARVFVERPELDSMVDGLTQLPATLRDAETIDQVAPELRARFDIDAEELAAVRAMVSEEGVQPGWIEAMERLRRAMARRPLVEPTTWQTERQRSAQLGGSEAGETAVVWLLGADSPDPIHTTAASLVNAGSDEQRLQAAETIASQAQLRDATLRGLVIGRLMNLREPTYRLDEALTAARQAEVVAQVEEASLEFQSGQVIVRRGEPVGLETIALLRSEREAVAATRGIWTLSSRLAGSAAVSALMVLGLTMYLAWYCPRVARNPERMMGIAGLFVACFALAVWPAAMEPRLVLLLAVAPTLLLAMLLVIAYDARIALAVAAGHAVLVTLALKQPTWFLFVPLCGAATAAWQLSDIRDRRAFVRTGLATALALALACAGGGLLGRPVSGRGLLELSWDMGFAASGGLVTAGLVLFILPSVEKAFDITTGMKLIELRDPKHPLLKELQRRAPGTYNHSMNVASIAEAAADAIGADALQTYVGALYHDVGKMNKPEYFVENQAGGPNKHDKLSPAMSLLVIVGHVKDGLELAREFGLPRSLHHYIEAHHGTTLVEYFYHRAKQKAADEAEAVREKKKDAEGRDVEGGGDATEPSEIEYRYPGPKPRTKECAILMLADAIESATRTMADPTPSRIDQLVRRLAQKRLMDGQFDDCDLTLRELDAVGDSISKTVASIYHGRIAYPGGGEKRA
ncbi:MAG: HDIG domain-containing protein [Phycisphaerales bacterium]